MQNQSGDELTREGYGLGGVEVDCDSGDCWAKKATDPETGDVLYWVRRGGHRDRGKLYDPDDAFYDGGDPNLYDPGMGRRRFEFVRAKEEEFSHYLLYLKSGATLHLKRAERCR